jgi:shikimate dehydrogenase
VNTFWIEGGRLIGDNTDVGGFDTVARDVLGALGPPNPIRVAVIGAGGAAAAVLTALERWSGARVGVFSRSAERTQRLCERFGQLAEPAHSAADAVSGAALVVNATPIGLADETMPVDPALLDPRAVAIDLVYRRAGTAWTRAVTRLGHRAVDGTDMLLEQGALAFQRWFGVPADRAVMRAALLE